ncbi:glycosyltransferase [Candidatus Woesearchaeota archaeon]|nr:glycosyltransferase [Candidatus Woesearchaeota archaeon]
MRICIVCDDIFPSLGGKGKVAERYAKKLVEKGHEVIVFAGKYKNKKGFQKKDKIKLYRFSGFALPKSNYTFFIGIPFPYKLYRILKNYQIDIVNIYSGTYLTLLSVLAAKALGIPILASIHSQPENLTANIGIKSSLTKKYFYRFIVGLCNMSDAVQVPSEFTYKLLKKNGLNKKAEVISNGVDLKFFNPHVDDSSFSRKFHLEGKKIVLYVGRLMKEKNVETLIKSFRIVSKKIKNAVLVIVGDGFLGMKLKQLAHSLGISNKVIFTGRIPENSLNMAFASADLFVLPSLVELQGLVVLEAMASGKPLLIAKSKKSASKELLVEGRNGYTFKPKNKYDLASKIIRLLKDKALRLKMGKYNLVLIKNHDMKKCVDKMGNLFRTLIKNAKEGNLVDSNN